MVRTSILIGVARSMQSILQSEFSNKERRRESSMRGLSSSSGTEESDSECTVAEVPVSSVSIIELSDTLGSSVNESADPTSSTSEDSNDVFSVSDTDSDSSVEYIEKNDECVDLTELENDDDSIKIVSTKKEVRPVVDHFTLDTTPDFIPLGPHISNIKTHRGRKKRRNQNFKKPIKRLSFQQKHNQKHALKRRITAPQKTLPLLTIQSENSIVHPLAPTNWGYPNQGTAPPEALLIASSEPESSIAVPLASNRSHQSRPTRIIQLSYPNILNDNAEDTQKTGLRPIIIDGCNVGFGYGKGDFVMRGPILVIQYFKNRGHDEIVCFLPQSYRHRTRSPSEERTVSNLEKEDMFSFTPSRNLVNGQKYIPYDDRFILQYATERQGVIISNDGYRDLINEEPSWKETIEKRIINYTFARDIFMLPKDPMGRAGPTLDEILKFPTE